MNSDKIGNVQQDLQALSAVVRDIGQFMADEGSSAAIKDKQRLVQELKALSQRLHSMEVCFSKEVLKIDFCALFLNNSISLMASIKLARGQALYHNSTACGHMHSCSSSVKLV